MCPLRRGPAARARGIVVAIACVLIAALAVTVGAGERVIVILGDSLTAGLGVAPDEAYPARLQARLTREGYPYRVVNAGVSGDTTAGGLRRLPWLLRQRPEIAIVALGANDGLRGLDLSATRRNLEEAIALAQGAGVRVVLAGMKLPPNYGPAYTREFEALFPQLADAHEIALIPFLLEGVAARPELNLADGIHPNARGYQRVADNVLAVLLPLL